MFDPFNHSISGSYNLWGTTETSWFVFKFTLEVGCKYDLIIPYHVKIGMLVILKHIDENKNEYDWKLELQRHEPYVKKELKGIGI